MKKILSIILVLSLIMSLFVGCGSEKDTTSNSDTKSEEASKETDSSSSEEVKEEVKEEKEEVTIEFWYTANESDPKDPYNLWNSKNIELFMEANPHITIEKVIIGGAGGENYRTKLTSEAAVGNLPDIFMTWLGSRLEPMVKLGSVLPLDEMVSEDEAMSAMIDRSVLSKAIFDDKIYAIPKASDAEGLFYNKALFEEYNLDLPKSLDDLIQVSKVFNDNGIASIALGNSVSWVTQIPFSYILLDLDPDIYSKMTNETISYDDPVFIEAAQKLKMLVDENVFLENFNGIAPAESRAEFIEGNAAMFLQGTWNIAALKDGMGENVGFIPFPTVSENSSLVLKTSPHGYAISKESEHLEEVKEFYKFMMSEERLLELADEFSIILPWGSIEVEPKTDNPVYNDVANVFASYNESFDLVSTYTKNDAIGIELGVAIQAITAGADIDETFEKLEAYRKQNSN